MDWDSLFTENKQWDKLNEAGYVGEELGQRKNEYGNGGVFGASFLAPDFKSWV